MQILDQYKTQQTINKLETSMGTDKKSDRTEAQATMNNLRLPFSLTSERFY